MAGFVREWLLSITGGAALCSMALLLCPKGGPRRVLSCLCSLVMALALISPVLELDVSSLAPSLAQYRSAGEGAAARGRSLTKSIIEQETAAYILDKAERLGLADVSAEVTLRWDDGAGLWYPWEAAVTVSGPEEAAAALGAAIESELGIPSERQSVLRLGG